MVTLGRKTVGVGDAFVYEGWWPVLGQINGLLKTVFLAREFSFLHELRFFKAPHSSLDCDSSNLVVPLIPGRTLSGQDSVQLFGSATPRLPVKFVACGAIFNPLPGPGGGTTIHKYRNYPHYPLGARRIVERGKQGFREIRCERMKPFRVIPRKHAPGVPYHVMGQEGVTISLPVK